MERYKSEDNRGIVMTPIEKEIIGFNAVNTLANLNEYFDKHKTMSLKVFMDIQKKSFEETKKEYDDNLSFRV